MNKREVCGLLPICNDNKEDCPDFEIHLKYEQNNKR